MAALPPRPALHHPNGSSQPETTPKSDNSDPRPTVLLVQIIGIFLYYRLQVREGKRGGRCLIQTPRHRGIGPIQQATGDRLRSPSQLAGAAPAGAPNGPLDSLDPIINWGRIGEIRVSSQRRFRAIQRSILPRAHIVVNFVDSN